MRIAAAFALALAAPAAAQEAPKFAYGKGDAAQGPAWTASVQIGFGSSTGNAQNLNLTGGASAAHRFGDDMISAEVSAALARSRLFIASEADGTPGIGPDEVRTVTQTTSQAWLAKARYDRFFGPSSSLYASAELSGDEPAGKELLAGGQVGYSRALHRTGKSLLLAEVGFDWSRQKFVSSPDAVSIGSLRAFLRYQGAPLEPLRYHASLEYLANVNEERTPSRRVGAFGDNRLAGKLGLDVKLSDAGSLGVRFRALYDSAPAQRPPPAGAAWEAGYAPLAERLDTVTELVLVYKLL